MFNAFKKELQRQAKLLQECFIILPVLVLVLIIFGINAWCDHYNYHLYKNRLQRYTQAQESYFKKVGGRAYEVLQSFNEDIGEEILNPPEYDTHFRSEDY